MAHRGYSASGRMAAAGVAVLYLLAASTAFVPSSGGAKGLRGATSSSGADFAPFPDQADMQADGSERSSLAMGAQAAMLAAVFGLVAGMAPVRAEEAAPADAPKASYREETRAEREKDEAARRSAPSKEERVKRALEQLAAEPKLDDNFAFKRDGAGQMNAPKGGTEKVKRTPVKEKKSGGAVSFSVPSEEGGKKKVIISPADDLDEDEMSMARPNQPLLFLLFATPVTIYLFFYVLGSLNVI